MATLLRLPLQTAIFFMSVIPSLLAILMVSFIIARNLGAEFILMIYLTVSPSHSLASINLLPFVSNHGTNETTTEPGKAVLISVAVACAKGLKAPKVS